MAMVGSGIHKFTKQNFNKEKLETISPFTNNGKKYINEIDLGDRRLIFIDGDYVDR